MESVDAHASPSGNCIVEAQVSERGRNALLQTIWSLSAAAVRIITLIPSHLSSPLSYVCGILFSVVTTLLAPFLPLGHILLSMSLAPLRLVAKGEILYVYLSWAVLVGVFSGLFLFKANRLIGGFLQIPVSSAVLSKRDLRGHPSKESQHRNLAEKEEEGMTGPEFFADWANHQMAKTKDRSLLSTKILEEEDDSHEYD